MRYFSAVAAGALLCGAPGSAASRHGWDKASSVARDALVLTSLGVPAVQGDWNGDKQAAFALGGSFALTELLKRATHEQRPDHSDDLSFPSGHSSSSFAAAATLEKRYGWQVGVPAHVVAAFVAVARVQAHKHFVHDVVAGAAIGEAAGWLVTSKKDARVQWLPFGDSHGGGATVAVRF